MTTERSFIPLNIAVLVVSDSRTEADDVSGNTLVERLQSAGHQFAIKAIVPDDIYQIRATVSAWIADADIQAGMEGRAPLANDDRAGIDGFAAIDLHAESFRFGVAAVSG